MKKRLLVLDCSFQGLSLMVGERSSDGQRCHWIYHQHLPDRRGSAEDFNALWQLACAQIPGLSVQDLDGVAVGKGPGSFTGVRIVLSWAAGFALGMGHERWLGFNTLELGAQGFARQQSRPMGVLFMSTRDFGFLSLAQPDGTACTLPLKCSGKGEQLAQFALDRACQHGYALETDALLHLSASHTATDFGMPRVNSQQLWQAVTPCLAEQVTVSAYWADQLPEANYMRQSTAEERLQQSSQSS
ncbi:MAG: hypothetical protein OXT67_02965 [Zetaproteobacteria bacterium]|nr:hypothetical protein [Zetaproteobacteria bacterium]